MLSALSPYLFQFFGSRVKLKSIWISIIFLQPHIIIFQLFELYQIGYLNLISRSSQPVEVDDSAILVEEFTDNGDTTFVNPNHIDVNTDNADSVQRQGLGSHDIDRT